MRDRPILFSGPMINAILEGRKTQTRRVPKLSAAARCAGVKPENAPCPFKAGTKLWVRETFGYADDSDGKQVVYRADAGPIHETTTKWNPSIFMPRWASRIRLEIVSVRLERLNEISGEDAISEGWPREQELFPNVNTTSKAQDWYMRLWDSINGKKFPWSSNPWVWVIEFKRI